MTGEKFLTKLEECSNMRERLDGIVSKNSVLFLNNIDRDYLMTQKRVPTCPNPCFTARSKFLLTIYVRKDFSFLDDKVIRRIMSSGLIIKWKKDVVGEFMTHIYPGPVIEFEHLTPVFKMYP